MTAWAFVLLNKMPTPPGCVLNGTPVAGGVGRLWVWSFFWSPMALAHPPAARTAMCDVGVVCVPVHRAHLNSSPAYAHWHLGVWGLLCAVWEEWAWSVWCVGRGSAGISRDDVEVVVMEMAAALAAVVVMTI